MPRNAVREIAFTRGSCAARSSKPKGEDDGKESSSACMCAGVSTRVCVLEARSRVRADEERAVRVVSRYVCTRALRDGTEVNTRSRSHSRAITRITGAQTAERGSQSVSSLSLSTAYPRSPRRRRKSHQRSNTGLYIKRGCVCVCPVQH